MTTGSFLDDLQKAAWDTQHLLGARLGWVVLPGLWSPMLNQTRRIDCPLRVTLPKVWGAGVLPGCPKQGAVWGMLPFLALAPALNNYINLDITISCHEAFLIALLSQHGDKQGKNMAVSECVEACSFIWKETGFYPWNVMWNASFCSSTLWCYGLAVFSLFAGSSYPTKVPPT